MKKLFPILVSSFLLLVSILLLSNSLINGTNFVALTGINFFTSFVIYFSSEISELDIKNLRLILKQANTVKNEIEKLGLSIIELLSKHSAFTSGSWKQRKHLNDSMEQTLKLLGIKDEEIVKTMNKPRLMERYMKDHTSLTKKEKEEVSKFFNIDEDSK